MIQHCRCRYAYGGENRIEGNHIHHHMQVLGDGGAIYTLGVQGNRPFEVDANGHRQPLY